MFVDFFKTYNFRAKLATFHANIDAFQIELDILLFKHDALEIIRNKKIWIKTSAFYIKLKTQKSLNNFFLFKENIAKLWCFFLNSHTPISEHIVWKYNILLWM